MDCSRYKEFANLFMDGELNADSEVELFRHISNCEDCRLFVETMSKVDSLGKSEKIQFPQTVDDKLFAALALVRSKKGADRSRFRSYFRREVMIPLPFAAALAVILVFGGLLFGLLLKGTPFRENPAIATGQDAFGHPSAVIVFYELPPIDVIGKPVLKEARYNKIYNR